MLRTREQREARKAQREAEKSEWARGELKDAYTTVSFYYPLSNPEEVHFQPASPFEPKNPYVPSSTYDPVPKAKALEKQADRFMADGELEESEGRKLTAIVKYKEAIKAYRVAVALDLPALDFRRKIISGSTETKAKGSYTKAKLQLQEKLAFAEEKAQIPLRDRVYIPDPAEEPGFAYAEMSARVKAAPYTLARPITPSALHVAHEQQGQTAVTFALPASGLEPSPQPGHAELVSKANAPWLKPAAWWERQHLHRQAEAEAQAQAKAARGGDEPADAAGSGEMTGGDTGDSALAVVEDGASSSSSSSDEESPHRRTVVAIGDFPAQQEGDLRLRKGDVIEVLDDSSEWWQGCLKRDPSLRGLFPSNYVEDPEVKSVMHE